MIRLTAMLRRNPSLSADQFDAHWRGTHADLMRAVPGVGDMVVRYEQHPRAVAAGRWTGSDGYDGVAVQWFRSLDGLDAFLRSPAYAETVAPDERRLLDLDHCVFLLTDEPRIVIQGE